MICVNTADTNNKLPSVLPGTFHELYVFINGEWQRRFISRMTTVYR